MKKKTKGKKTMHKVVLIIVLTLMWGGCTSPPKNLEITTFLGFWTVDFDRTMEESKKSPKYNEKEAERMPKMIKRMMEKMKINLIENEMIYLMGKRKMTLPYTVTSSDQKSVTLSMKQGIKEITVVLTQIEKDYMNLKSSETDDMDYYIWKKESEVKSEN